MAKTKSGRRVTKTVRVTCPYAGAVVECMEATSGRVVSSKRAPAQLSVKRSAGTFDRYLGKLIKVCDPDRGLSAKSVAVLDGLITDLAQRLTGEAARLALYNSRKTITVREVQAAVGLVLKGDLAKRANEEGRRACLMYSRYSSGDSSSTAEKAQLSFPVPRVLSMLKTHKLRVGLTSAILATAALEYVAAELLSVVCSALKEADKRLILPRYIGMALQSDDDLSRVFPDARVITG